MAAKTGVYPVFENKFKIGTSGSASTTEQMATVSNLETFSVSIDGNVEEWKPMEAEGWVRRLKTGSSLKISFSGKRCIGDAGNDYVAGSFINTGVSASTKFEWEFPSGAKLEMPCVMNVTNVGGGDSTNVAALEFEIQSDGKPTFTPAS
ncbi:MAG: phage tail protein [Faecalibacterium sp.]|jgi:hypothetical protein|nr:phage tail protein [Faecalibacterium sp.]